MGFLGISTGKGDTEGAGRGQPAAVVEIFGELLEEGGGLFVRMGGLSWLRIESRCDLRFHDISRTILSAGYDLTMERVIEGTTVCGSPRRRFGCAECSVWARRNRASPPRNSV